MSQQLHINKTRDVWWSPTGSLLGIDQTKFIQYVYNICKKKKKKNKEKSQRIERGGILKSEIHHEAVDTRDSLQNNLMTS